MSNYYQDFIALLDAEDKDRSVEFVLNLLENETMSLESVYLELLTPSLTNFQCKDPEREICIWREHTRTSIVRTILECTYPYIIKRRQNIPLKQSKIVVLTPSEEYHEIGPIIVNNFFLLAGYSSQYIGANTPKDDILKAMKALNPDYIAFSVTDYYNIVATKKVTDEIKRQYPNVKIILGGQAFSHKGALSDLVYDFHLTSVYDIAKLEEGASK